MKKILTTIAIIILILATVLYGCNNNSNNPPKNNTTIISITVPEKEIDISIFQEVEPSCENLDVYRQEVTKRLQSGQLFISDEEWAVIQEVWEYSVFRHPGFFVSFDSFYNNSSKYSYPVVFRDEQMLILWYTTESGSLSFKKLFGTGDIASNYGGQVHYDGDEQVISSQITFSLTYNQETGKVSYWKFGKAEECFTGIPSNSVYCGYSEFEGHLFRHGTDVYELNYRVNADNSDEVFTTCIAHNVKYVIDANYRASSDCWSNPLFMMEDGTVKVYVHWEGGFDKEPDDPCHLVSPYHEGGIEV